MSVDPVILTSLFNTFGTIADAGIKQLIDSKIIVHKGATLYMRASEIEFAFVLSLGDEQSRVGTILKRIQSITKKPLEFENVIEINGHGMPHNENLVEMEIITIFENKGKIDFGKLLRDVKSNMVFIKARVNVSKELIQFLVPSRIVKTSEHFGDEKIEADIELALDYANLWRKIFDQYTVRDIEYEFNLQVSPETIIKQIPEKSRKRIISAGIQALQNNKDAVNFLRIMSSCFLSFENDAVRKKLFDTVSVEPTSKLSIKDVYPTMQSMVIAKSNHPVTLPGKLRIVIGGKLEGDDITLHGKLKIDLKKFSKIVNDISKDIQDKTNKLKI